MYYLLQIDEEFKDSDIYVIKNMLDERRRIHDYVCTTYNDLDKIINDKNLPIQDMTPIGSIKFVQEFLKKVHGINEMNPIEVPKILRKEKYLKRKYEILSNENLPESGLYFLKYASKLKDFSYRGLINYLPKEDPGNGEPYLKEGLYVVSELVDILSEYRCFIYNDKIEGIQYYDGDCTVFPSKDDVNLLKEMVNVYSLDKNRPFAYTMDVAIIKDKGLCILECHPHTSVGLYGYNNSNLLYSYTYGFDWYIDKNNKIEL